MDARVEKEENDAKNGVGNRFAKSIEHFKLLHPFEQYEKDHQKYFKGLFYILDEDGTVLRIHKTQDMKHDLVRINYENRQMLNFNKILGYMQIRLDKRGP